MRSLNFLIDLILPAAMVLGLTQPLAEMSTRNLPGSKGRLAREADFTAICSRLSRKCGSLDVSQPPGPLRPVTGTSLFFYSSIQKKATLDSIESMKTRTLNLKSF
jgi:hypothetical protein